MKSYVYFLVFPLLGLFNPANASANLVLLDAGNATVSFDSSLINSGLSIDPVNNGFNIGNIGIWVNDSMSGYETDNGATRADFSAIIDLLPKAGYKITSYNVSLSSINSGGYEQANGQGSGYSEARYINDAGYDYSGHELNAWVSTQAIGWLEPWSFRNYEQVGVTYEWVPVFETVVVGTEYTSPDCQYDGCPTQDIVEERDLSYYIEQPIYDYVEHPYTIDHAMESFNSLDAIYVTANISAVPIPAAWLLFASGMAFAFFKRK